MTDFQLPLLAPHQEALQKCVYCPKLSRAACPVANEEGSETVTPWGKMSLAYFAGRADVPVDAEHAESAWACSACYGCRERCEHKNPVADVLVDARADYFERGVAPAAAKRVSESFAAHQAANRAAVEILDPANLQSARVTLLVGCAYTRHLPDESRAIVKVANAFIDAEIKVARQCCGLSLLYAGDRPGYEAAAAALVEEVRDSDFVVVADPGCARTLLQPPLGSKAACAPVANVVPMVDVVFSGLDRLPAARLKGRSVHYHDPCQLGRGLGRYDEPRAILARMFDVVVGELERNRERAECSGGGGLLPLTRPTTSAAMAKSRLAARHPTDESALQTVVSACGASVRRLRASADEGVEVVDLMSLVAESLA